MKKIYYSWADVEGAVLEISRQIIKSKWQPDYIVGITRGGAIPAVLLSQYLGVKMRPLEVSLRDGGECVSDLGMAEEAFGYVPLGQQEIINSRWDPSFKKNILIVDDINDTGATINWIKKDWPSGCLPDNDGWNRVWHNNVKFAVLTDNVSSNADVDYSAWEVNKREEDCWLVYPWEDFWRNDN
jgi:hypoxanthine phosphoribosyltransferase